MTRTFPLTSLIDILAKKASELTDEDVEATVQYLRSQRAKFAAEEIEKAKKPAKPRAKEKALAGAIDLEALGLD